MIKFNLKKFLKSLNANDFVKACSIPLGYKVGFPMIQKRAEKVYITLPYRKYKNTNQPGKFTVMPIEYVLTFELRAVPEVPQALKNVVKEDKLSVQKIPVGFCKLSGTKEWAEFPFAKPVGVFPHNALKQKDATELNNTRDKIYENYDIMINDLLGIESASGADKMEFSQLLGEIVEPGLKPMYRLLDEEFYNQYLA